MKLASIDFPIQLQEYESFSLKRLSSLQNILQVADLLSNFSLKYIITLYMSKDYKFLFKKKI